ncbi:MAG TPA: GNAT family N-acetyltransferase [Microthrixaceae bacterium]|nr:GNAT family N-acetyltransferase [Microthrixaceae bacterium]
MTAGDLDEVLDLNERCTPHVGPVDRDRLAAIVGESSLALVARDAAGLAGFVIVLGPGAGYDSPNYRWFAERYEDFRYVDRIAVDPARHRGGLGRRLYQEVFDHARAEGSPVVTCEVNLEPPNPVSQRFHASLGFTEVGRQDTYGGTVVVQLLERRVDTT